MKVMNTNATRRDFKLTPQLQQRAWILICLGLAAGIFGFAFDPQRTWMNLLINGYYFVGLAVSGTFFVALQYLCGARWAEALRRIPEAISGYLPYAAFLMLLLFFGLPALYEWAGGAEAEHVVFLEDKAAYLSIPAYMTRMVIFLGLWIFFSFVMRRNSLQEDAAGNELCRKKNVMWSVLFMIVFAYTFSLGSVDWIMSLEPHWYSTMFSVYTFSGLFVNGIAVMSLMVILLRERGFLEGVNENHYHDLGKLLFAFSMFWAYIWFCQFMLIWYANIPEETEYFALRLHGNWNWLFFTNFFMNFVVPFFVLLPRSSKRNPAIIKRVAILLIVGHWLDLFLLVVPAKGGIEMDIGPIELLLALGYAGSFLFVVARILAKAPLMPIGSIHLEESLHHHQS